MKYQRYLALMVAGTLSLSTLLTGCLGQTKEADPDAIVATLDGEDITLGVLNFMAKYQEVNYENSYYYTYFGDTMWEEELSDDGKTLEENAKETILEEYESMLLLQKHMSDYGVEITDEEEAAITAAAEKFMSDNTEEALEKMGATQEIVEEALRLFTIQSKVRAEVIKGVDTNVTDEEAAQRTFSYVQTSTAGTYDDSGSYVEYTEEEVEALTTTMNEFQVAASADWDTALTTYGYTASTYSYGSDEDSMDESVIEAADALSAGEVSTVVTTEGYLYVLRLDSEFDETATEEKKTEIIEQRESDLFDEVCEGYKEESDWELKEKVWATVTFEGFFKQVTDEEETTDETQTDESAADETATDETTDETAGDAEDAAE